MFATLEVFVRTATPCSHICMLRPMMNVMARRLLGEVSWGLKMRVTMGAGLSILDMATDIFVLVGYMGKD